MILSASDWSVPDNRSIMMMSLVRTPFVNVLGFVFRSRMWIDCEGAGTN